MAREGAQILVHGGVYNEQIDLMGKSIRVEGLSLSDPSVMEQPIVDGNGVGPVVTFTSGEDANCVLAGLCIQGAEAPYAPAILCSGSPTITHCLIAGNSATDFQAAPIHCGDSNAVFINCTITENVGDAYGALMVCVDSNVTVTNSILWGNAPAVVQTVSGAAPTMSYCNVEGGWAGEGNMDVNPAFVACGWSTSDGAWSCGDYHVLSEAGHWDMATGTYCVDPATSPCIDAGDPGQSCGTEPSPNGSRVNLGVYGGTTQASRSP